MRAAVFLDFDDTVTVRNAAHLVLNKFAPDALKRFRGMYLDGEIGFREYQERAFDAIQEPLSDIQAAVAEGIEVRPGLRELVDAVRESDGSITVVSAGLDIYIEPVLKRHGLNDMQIACASAVRDGADTGAFRYDYSFGGQPCDGDWATCKCRVIKLAPSGVVTVFAGDSETSDSCAAPNADHVFARDRLLTFCEANGITATPFEDFYPVAAFVRELAERQPVEPER